MNPDSGHLIDPARSEKLRKLFEKDDRYEALPQNLEASALLELQGRAEATVDLTSNSELSLWAAEERRKRKRKTKQKLQKAARKRNRT